VAEALEAAHEQGIVHRDLKPRNIKVRRDGTVKVLDFGLAKALVRETGVTPHDPSESPTLTAATEIGAILGTAAYMSPEQARGKPVDRRADIWAFGAVLYEMLSGARAFTGADVSETLAAVLKDDVRWQALPAETPRSLKRLLRRCLERDPRRRLSAIGDARLELDEIDSAADARDDASAPNRRSPMAWLWPAAAGIVISAALAAVLWPRGASVAPAKMSRVSMMPPSGGDLYPDSTGVAISPDGTLVAFVVGGVTRSGNQLWVRSLDSLSARRLEDANDVTLPFWSPDSRRIGFFSDGKLKTIAASGGRAEVLCEATSGRGAAWSPSNVIVFAPGGAGPLYRISASGGVPEPITTLDAAKKEFSHRFPAFLPDGEHFLYATLPAKNGAFDIYAGSLKESSRLRIGAFETAPVYADPGWLVYGRQGVLNARAFDARTLSLSGDPIPLEDQPTSILDPTISFTAGRVTSVSTTGTLAYFSSSSPNTTATWYDATGRSLGTLPLPAGHYETVKISPDGTRALVGRSTSTAESSLWLADLVRGSAVPFASGHGRNDTPIWSRDGKRVLFQSDRDGSQNIYVKVVDEASDERLVFRSPFPFNAPNDWSADGQQFVMTILDPQAAENVWLMPVAGGAEPKALMPARNRHYGGPVSPDGRWLAFVSDETGRFEAFVQALPDAGTRVQVSQQGASLMWWTKDGRALLFLSIDQRTLWRVGIEPGPTVHVGTATQLATFPPGIFSMDATPDRQRFLAVAPERTDAGTVTVVFNLRAALDHAR
jgi:Tol biopolymer transport system component